MVIYIGSASYSLFYSPMKLNVKHDDSNDSFFNPILRIFIVILKRFVMVYKVLNVT